MEKTNPQLQILIQELKKVSSKENVGIWRAIAENLEDTARHRRIVNLSKINRVAGDNETLVIPGKVLASGELNRKVTIAAFKFSKNAAEKIAKMGKAVTIMDLLKQNPKGKNIKIIG